MAADTKLKVVYHEDHEVVVTEVRGHPNLCKDCRFSGWLTNIEFRNHVIPVTCLLFSGGADPRDGDRVIYDNIDNSWDHDRKDERWRHRYPYCSTRNADGACESFLASRPKTFWQKLWDWRASPRERRRRMRE